MIRFTPSHFLSKIERDRITGFAFDPAWRAPRARRCARWCRTDGGPCAPRRAATKYQKQNFKTLPRRTAGGRGKLSEFCFFVIGSLLLFVIRIILTYCGYFVCATFREALWIRLNTDFGQKKQP